MQDNVSVLISTIVVVVIIVLFPIYNIATRQDSIANNMVVRATTNFVDEVRNKGYIDKESYGNYLNELDKTGNTYDVELEVYKPLLLETVDSTNDDKEFDEHYEIDYTDAVIAGMENATLFKDDGSVKKSDVYYLYDDYKFYVRVKNTNVTQAQILLDRLLGGKQNERIVVNYGGIVYSNEWAHGENAESANANISISRPLNNSLKEFKYEYITDIYDQTLDELKTVYAIAVRLSDSGVGAGNIKFRLKYNNVEQLTSESGTVLNTEVARENHVKSYIETEGFVVEQQYIKVDEISVKKDGDAYDYEYIITLSNISYNFQNNPYIEGRVKINAGSAYTKSGQVSELNSKYFVITYELNEPIVVIASTPDVINNNVVAPISGGTNITFNITGQLESDTAKVLKAVVEITNNGTVVKNEVINLDANGKGSISYKFTDGTGSISAYVIDSRGTQSEKVGYGFIVMNNYLSASINTRGITEMNTVVIPNATISAYSFGGKFPSHAGSDWWRVTGLVKGTTNTWEVISPLTGTYIPSGQTLRANKANGADFNTGMIEIEDPRRYVQLKFEYRTDPSHDGSSCLRNATIDYKVDYKF